MDKEIFSLQAKKVQDLQMMEQTLQNILVQKQTFQLELNEVLSALDELKDSNEEVFKIVGQIMIKSKKEKLKEDLKAKKDFLELRIKNLDKQEKSFREKLYSQREEIMKELK